MHAYKIAKVDNKENSVLKRKVYKRLWDSLTNSGKRRGKNQLKKNQLKKNQLKKMINLFADQLLSQNHIYYN